MLGLVGGEGLPVGHRTVLLSLEVDAKLPAFRADGLGLVGALLWRRLLLFVVSARWSLLRAMRLLGAAVGPLLSVVRMLLSALWLLASLR